MLAVQTYARALVGLLSWSMVRTSCLVYWGSSYSSSRVLSYSVRSESRSPLTAAGAEAGAEAEADADTEGDVEAEAEAEAEAEDVVVTGRIAG